MIDIGWLSALLLEMVCFRKIKSVSGDQVSVITSQSIRDLRPGNKNVLLFTCGHKFKISFDEFRSFAAFSIKLLLKIVGLENFAFIQLNLNPIKLFFGSQWNYSRVSARCFRQRSQLFCILRLYHSWRNKRQEKSNVIMEKCYDLHCMLIFRNCLCLCDHWFSCWWDGESTLQL